MKPAFRKIALALAMAAALNPAHAGVLTFQDVVFTTTWANNVLTLEIDAARHGGDWSRATMLGALSLKDIGSFTSVSVRSAPKGVDAWTLNSKELNAAGCAGGSSGSRSNKALCLSGTPIALANDMVFTFAFTGGNPDLDEPHLKVNFLDASKNKVGDLLSKTIKSTPVVVTQPVTPAPVTPTPVTPTPVTPTPVTPTPVTPTPVTPAPVTPTEPSTTPVTGGTTVPTPGDTTEVSMPPVDIGPTVPIPPPLPSPVPVPPPLVELEPVSAGSGTSEVPEPHMIALMLGGLALMGAALRKRR